MIRAHVRALAFLGLLAVSAACATTPRAGDEIEKEQNRITRTEIEAAEVRNAHELVQRLRPRWLVARGPRSLGTLPTSILVYVNSSRVGDVESLRQIETESIAEMEYLDGPRASATLPGIGSAHVAGAIVIKTTPRR